MSENPTPQLNPCDKVKNEHFGHTIKTKKNESIRIIFQNMGNYNYLEHITLLKNHTI